VTADEALDRSSTGDVSSPAMPPPAGPAPGLREQLGSTKDSVKGLLDAHVDLAKTEMGSIAGQVARAAGLVGVAIALFVLVGLLLVIGGALFVAEWLLGSMGWGVLHGTLLFSGFALMCILVLLGFGAGRLIGYLGLSLLVGIAIAVVLGLDLLNQAYTAIGNAVIPGVDPAWRTILAGAVTGAIVVGVLALIPAIRMGGGGAVGVIILGLVVGALLGAFTAITFSWRPAFGVGLTVAYTLWLVLQVADLFRTGVDDEALKARFYPSQTIDTTKETLEWLKRRMPRANES
jgi:hypothetical protein